MYRTYTSFACGPYMTSSVKTPINSPESISLKTIVSQCPYYCLTPWMVGTYVVLPIRGLRLPGVHHHRSVNEPGRITFICNPALSPPTVLLRLLTVTYKLFTKQATIPACSHD
jgi:hypothetical protein